MTATPNASVPAADDAPVQGFSHCHEGIVAQLRDLEQLPVLAEAAARARGIAKATADFYRQVVLTHHSEEEQALFSAVLASAERGAERDHVQAIVIRLTQDHRQIESLWRTMAHAQYEEEVFLPLCRTILGRNGNHMAALGMSFHVRHAMPEVPLVLEGPLPSA